MEAIIKVNMDNVAFDDGGSDELARILRELAKRIADGGLTYKPLMDINGNRVGTFVIE